METKTLAKPAKKLSAKAQLKRDEDRVNSLIHSACHGVQIGIFDLGKVFKVGLAALSDGLDDAGISQKIREFAESIRKN